MTPKELYEWAKANGAEDLPIKFSCDNLGYLPSENVFVKCHIIETDYDECVAIW